MMVCGIDPSLNGTGLVFYDTKTKKVYAVHFPQKMKPGFEPLLFLSRNIERYIAKYRPQIIGIEEPFVFKGRYQGAIRVFYLHALLRRIIFRHKALLYEYPPKSWKKRFTGSGNADKDAVIHTASFHYGRDFCTHDEADAFGIMRVALMDYKKERNVAKARNGRPKRI
jgi:Holliday junction resolvasome RuvABC endonuclease subunit